ncbi:MAG: hypothetical protein BWK76_01075 [Desulfobulbaceae bacterium A2]|nr:MAG: hypothetical protein BWK76_01075 [Desulfobulbaceae bacterium A2]
MKKHTIPALALFVTLATLSSGQTAGADDVPKRKSGLWEIKTLMDGAPSQAIQQCIDSDTDNLAAQRLASAEKAPKCSAMESKRQGGKLLLHSVCAMETTTATTDTIITGSFDSGYRSEMTVRYDPPMMGTSSSKIVQEATWLGPCKPGQKPGDIIMPGMGQFNMQDMQAQQQQIQEMMQRNQQR